MEEAYGEILDKERALELPALRQATRRLEWKIAQRRLHMILSGSDAPVPRVLL
jgi:hypothetical protein